MRNTAQPLPVNADSAGQKKKKGLFGGLGCLGLLIIVILIAVVGGQGGDKDKAAAPLDVFFVRGSNLERGHQRSGGGRD